jgi:hypothetical protein
MYLACARSTLKRSPIATLRASCLWRSSDRAGCDSTVTSLRLNAEFQRSQISQSSRTRAKRPSSTGETKNVSPYSSDCDQIQLRRRLARHLHLRSQDAARHSNRLWCILDPKPFDLPAFLNVHGLPIAVFCVGLTPAISEAARFATHP